MKTIMGDFIVWRVWLYLLDTIGEPGHRDAMSVIDKCQQLISDEAFDGCEATDCGVTALNQLRIARKLALWQREETA